MGTAFFPFRLGDRGNKSSFYLFIRGMVISFVYQAAIQQKKNVCLVLVFGAWVQLRQAPLHPQAALGTQRWCSETRTWCSLLMADYGRRTIKGTFMTTRMHPG